MSQSVTSLPIGILGASGYTGADLIRLLCFHPHVAIRVITGERHAGQQIEEVFPHLGRISLPCLTRFADVIWDDIAFVFCALPHTVSQEIIAQLPEHIRIVDLSADFRLKDRAVYTQWYGCDHQAWDLQAKAVYGLTEIYRDVIKSADLVANPGCYPTAVLLPLIPLIQHQLIQLCDIIIDAKSGVSGAGRDPKPHLHFCEVNEGLCAYGIAQHRHLPEIEQELSSAARHPVTVSFTPHLVPMSRGELVTMYLRLADGATLGDLRSLLHQTYAHEPFVEIMPEGVSPSTQEVRGSNRCRIGLFADRRSDGVIVIAVIDNLVKGASGQAIQNMNLMYGWDERLGVMSMPLFP